MRILGFSRPWEKLRNPSFTTFRFSRKDKDWQVEEVVQIVFRPRSKNRKLLGIARIIHKEPRRMVVSSFCLVDEPMVSDEEAIVDGFHSYRDMWGFLNSTYSLDRLLSEPMNKLTLRWIERVN